MPPRALCAAAPGRPASHQLGPSRPHSTGLTVSSHSTQDVTGDLCTLLDNEMKASGIELFDCTPSLAMVRFLLPLLILCDTLI